MKYSDLLENVSKPGEPSWKLDIDNKVYIVYDEAGKEVNRHQFQHVWDSSPARNAAQKDVTDMKVALRKAKSEQDAKDAEAKPLSRLEQEYRDLERSVTKYNKYIYPKTPEDDILDDETRDLYMQQSIKWMEKMQKYANGGTIRKSLINGTYKPPV
jgi:hypothetical protein